MSYKAEYIWIDGQQPTAKLRSKGKIVPDGEDPPIWGFDGSSTNQAPGENSDCVLNPVLTVPDPVRGGDNKLVMCEVLLTDMTPHPSNTRAACAAAAEKYAALDFWFGIEQEYTFFDGIKPLGWPDNGFPAPQGGYYCGVGSDEVFGRPVVEQHMDACLYAGLAIAGINGEVMPAQWEFQIGPDRRACRCRSPVAGPLVALPHRRGRGDRRRAQRHQRHTGPEAGQGRLEWRRGTHQLLHQPICGRTSRPASPRPRL